MPGDVTIRRAELGDEVALSLLGQATFLETFSGVLDGAAIVEHCRNAHSIAQYRSWLGDAQSGIWLAEASAGKAPVGYLGLAGGLPSTARIRG